MEDVEHSGKPFHFSTRVHLVELTGFRARNLKELLYHLKSVPGSVIYHHTHRYLQQHQHLSPEPPNDFAYWVSEALNEPRLGERLASISICEFPTIRGLRETIVSAIETYLEKPKKTAKEANEGEEFHFMKSVSFVLPTAYIAHNLKEFSDVLKRVTINAIYFHMFEAKLRLEKGVNDFSNWFEHSIGEVELAREVEKMDPYTYTMDALRARIIALIDKRLSETNDK